MIYLTFEQKYLLCIKKKLILSIVEKSTFLYIMINSVDNKIIKIKLFNLQYVYIHYYELKNTNLLIQKAKQVYLFEK